MWTWINDQKHEIRTEDKAYLLQLFRNTLFAENEADFAKALGLLQTDPVGLKYPQFHRHLKEDTFPKIDSWSLAKRTSLSLPTSNNNTNNLVESSFRYGYCNLRETLILFFLTSI